MPLISSAAYLPHWRLDRQKIAAARGGSADGTRLVASFDEDTTSMAVEAGRLCLEAARAIVPDQVVFVTTAPAYEDKCNAVTIHAALGLPATVAAYDMVGSIRNGPGAVAQSSLAAIAGCTTLVLISDIRTGLPGSAQELAGGDCAVALLFGPEGRALRQLGRATRSLELLARWRAPGRLESSTWDERFAADALAGLGADTLDEALSAAQCDAHSLDYVIVAGAEERVNAATRRQIGLADKHGADLTAETGNAGAAQPWLELTAVLESASPGERIAIIVAADGVECSIWMVDDAVAAGRSRNSVTSQLKTTSNALSYIQLLEWRGSLQREPPRRPDPTPPAAPPSKRSAAWKFAFVGSRCDVCGTAHLPPQHVCGRCGAVGRMTAESYADRLGRVVTYTDDRLAYSLSPPVYSGVVDFDSGGRIRCEFADVDPGALKVGAPVEPTFRRLFSEKGIHNYFWKMRPSRGAER